MSAGGRASLVKGWWTEPPTPSPHAEVARALRYLGEAPNWVPHDASVDNDVLIVGGGQTGLAVSFALRRAGVHRTSVIDAAPAGEAGVWRRKARMPALRTPKFFPGPDAGVSALTYAAWHEEKFGVDSYAALKTVPRRLWADYLDWLREVTQVHVRHDTRLVDIEPDGERFILHLEAAGRPLVERARKVVLATGAAGGGGLAIPKMLSDALPRRLYAHTDEDIDLSALRGKRIGVLGAASSAFDAAASALDAGAAEAHVFCRHGQLAETWAMPALAYAGGAENFFHLPDADRWNLTRVLRARGPAPTADTLRRALALDNFRLHLAAEWREATAKGDEVEVVAAGERFTFDFVIAGTGYLVDPASAPELRRFGDRIATWGDRHRPREDERDDSLARYPYLGDAFQYMEKEPNAAPFLKNIHCFNFSGMASYGRHVGDVGSQRAGVARLVTGVSRDLFLEEHAQGRLQLETPTEFRRADYERAVWRSAEPRPERASA